MPEPAYAITVTIRVPEINPPQGRPRFDVATIVYKYIAYITEHDRSIWFVNGRGVQVHPDSWLALKAGFLHYCGIMQ